MFHPGYLLRKLAVIVRSPRLQGEGGDHAICSVRQSEAAQTFA